MLFLAVFCGFLAEYQLEHVIEHNREKKFVKQMLADLRDDSTFFSNRIPALNTQLQKHQQFYHLMTSNIKPTDKDILNKCLPLLYTFDVSAVTATYDQMKTSGGLRYIQDQKLTSALQQYYEVLLPRVVKASDLEIGYYVDNINPIVLKQFRVQDFDYLGDSVKVANPIILGRTTENDQILLNVIEGYGSFHKVLLERLMIPCNNKLNELIELLKKEYHLQ